MPLRLVTITVSHYCEKARWALDRAGMRYTEDGHAPLVHRAFTAMGGGTSTPLLVTPHGSLTDSTDILRFADRGLEEARRLYPEGALGAEAAELEDHFDRKLGPATRALAYSYLMPDAEAFLRVVSRDVPRLEAAAVRALRRPMIALMKKGLGFTDGTRAWADERVRALFAEVGARLADGRRYLTGERFTAADLTFASLADPVVDRDDDPRARFRTEDAPSALAAERRELRKTPAGEYVARLYRDERGLSSAVAR
ncbi:MAG: glutathione S-transferase N-terminal domain-containing protein [Deltaproteobacteria bacterium]|nr:glutathione S-transferase N-terminal domain-containing protein [Deltaproteobacteria bacterium]